MFPNHVPIFTPTWEEFQDFSTYVTQVVHQKGFEAGLCKIIPPPEWTSLLNSYDALEVPIKKPVMQFISGSQGLFKQVNIEKRKMTIKEFQTMAESDNYALPKHLKDTDVEEIERRYWKNVTYQSPYYGADMPGSLFPENLPCWNVSKLDSLLTQKLSKRISGVNTAYLYVGMWKATFAWHTEDMDLYSINYVHFGRPKAWYCISPTHRDRFERLAQGFFGDEYRNCHEFLRHKMFLISPTLLQKYDIPFSRAVQNAGEFIITFPGAYHAGYNYGFNCAESTNFAFDPWIPIGMQAKSCECRSDSVKIDMTIFTDESSHRKRALSASDSDNEDTLRDGVRGGRSMTHTNPGASLAKRRIIKQKPIRYYHDKEQRPVNPIYCDVCFEHLDEKDPTQSCLSCRIVTHPACYALQQGHCQWCFFQNTKNSPTVPFNTLSYYEQDHLPACQLCPLYGGIYCREYQKEDSQWIHASCAYFMPDSQFIHAIKENIEYVDITHVDTKRFRHLLCALCKRKSGACLQCCKGQCKTAFHTSCAFKHSLYVSKSFNEEQSTQEEEEEEENEEKREEKKKEMESLLEVNIDGIEKEESLQTNINEPTLCGTKDTSSSENNDNNLVKIENHVDNDISDAIPTHSLSLSSENDNINSSPVEHSDVIVYANDGVTRCFCHFHDPRRAHQVKNDTLVVGQRVYVIVKKDAEKENVRKVLYYEGIIDRILENPSTTAIHSRRRPLYEVIFKAQDNENQTETAIQSDSSNDTLSCVRYLLKSRDIMINAPFFVERGQPPVQQTPSKDNEEEDSEKTSPKSSSQEESAEKLVHSQGKENTATLESDTRRFKADFVYY